MKLLARAVLPPAAPAGVRVRRLVAQLGRDLRAVGDGLRGVSPPPLIVRPPRRSSPTAAERSARTLRIVEVRRESADAVSLVLADPTGAALPCRPGQFFTVLVDVGGERLRRAYSASWIDPDGRQVAITVKRVAGGRVSNHLNDTARAGDLVAALGPSGDFGASDGAGPRHLVLIGAGSGITPLIAIARDRAGAADTRVTLVYGNRGADAILFRAELDQLTAGNLVVRHVLEEPGAVAARPGRLDEDAIAAELDAVAARGADLPTEYLVCGPAPVMDAARAVLTRRGVPAAAIREERFASPAAPPVVAGAPQVVTLRRPGAAQSVLVPAGATILDAGIAAGAALPFSCAMGGCGACAVRLVEGEVDLDEPSCLGADERARGVILTCVARPRTACTVELPR